MTLSLDAKDVRPVLAWVKSDREGEIRAAFHAALAARIADELLTREVLDVARVWAGHPVGFSLLTDRGRQFAVVV